MALLLLSPFVTGLIVYHGDKAFEASILAGSIRALRCGGCNKSRVLMVFQPRDPRRAIGESYDATALQIQIRPVGTVVDTRIRKFSKYVFLRLMQ
jgi:hypothetical protein